MPVASLPPEAQNLSSKACSLRHLRLPTFGFKSLGAGRQRFSLAFARALWSLLYSTDSQRVLGQVGLAYRHATQRGRSMQQPV